MNANLTFLTGEDTPVRQILGPPSHNRMLYEDLGWDDLQETSVTQARTHVLGV